MATNGDVRKTLNSYELNRINITIKPGDCVLMRSSDPSISHYVAKITRIQSFDNENKSVEVKVRWLYSPEETKGGRLQFHGVNEVFWSDHFDTQSVDSIEGKCTVHDFKTYIRRDVVDNKDFYCRFKYFPSTGEFYPDRTVVYCKCEMPYNPDDLMIRCDDCTEWYHPSCIDMTVAEAKQLDSFSCQKCLAERP